MNYRIIEYSAENFKRIRLANFKPKGRMTVFTGKNDQGKSSILDGVLYVFGGAKASPEVPLRRGASKLEVKLDLGTLVASRTASKLTVTPAKGSVAWDTPQRMLDSIYDELAFNPQEFANLKAEDQAEMLRATLGLEEELKRLDEANAKDFEARKVINAEVRRLTGEVAAIPVQDGLPNEKLNEEEIRDHIRAANESNKTIVAQIGAKAECAAVLERAERAEQQHMALIQAKTAEADKLAADVDKGRVIIFWLEDMGKRAQFLFDSAELQPYVWIAKVRDAIDKLADVCQTDHRELVAQVDAWDIERLRANQVLQAALDTEQSMHEAVAEARVNLENAPSGQMIDTQILMEQLEHAQMVNREIDKRSRREGLEAQLKTAQTDSSRYTRAMEDRDEEKRNAVANAKMPIEGLTLGEKTVLYQGIPVKQLGEAKQILLGVSIAMARDPKLRLVLIPHGEALDEDSLAELAAMAEEKDFYVWMAKVETSGRVGLYIEDGMIAKEND